MRPGAGARECGFCRRYQVVDVVAMRGSQAQRWPALLFGLLSALVAGLLLFAPMRDVVLRFVHDDAYYYFGIARQWSRHGFSTFDGINPTNGYHPLWQWLLVASAPAFPDADIFARVGAASGVFLLGGAALLVARRLASEHNPFSQLACMWVAATLLLATIYGMEAPLAAFVLALAILAVPSHRADWSSTRAFACGAATALLFLARIDALVWVIALDVIVLVAMWRTDRRRVLPMMALLAVVQLVVVAGYFAGNWLAWGHALPISAEVKAARSPLFSLAVPPSLLFLLAVGVGVIGLAPLAEFCVAARTGRSDRTWTLATPAWLGLSNLGYLALIAAKGGHETYNWYFVLTVFSGAYLLPFAMERYAAARPPFSRPALARWSVAACVLLLIVSAHSKLTKSSYFVGAYDKAMALAAHPEGTLVLAATDCGILGYFSRQRVMNLDGLTNSWEFQAALAEGRLGTWLTNRGLNAYVAPPVPEGGMVLLHARAGLASEAQAVPVRVEPLRPDVPSSGVAHVYQVTMIEPPSLRSTHP